MRIGIDISTVLNHGKDIGAGRYIYNLIKNMLALNIKDTFVLTARHITDEYLPIIDELKAFSNSGEFKKSKENEKLEKSAYKKSSLEFKLFKVGNKKLNIWNNLGFPQLEVLGFNTDILHCPDFLIPPTTNKNIILTIHDLAFIRFPHFNFDWFVKKYTKEVRKNSARAKKIIAVSHSTKKDIVDFFKTTPSKVDVIYEAAEENFRKLNEEEIDRNLLGKYKILKKFILSVGTIEPRKNYVTLIKAFNLLKSSCSDFAYQLVIVGRTGWMSEAAYVEYEKSPYKKDIIFTGRVPDSELIHIYNMAEVFVYPSIFEGFGLPVIEALQCGLPVTASRTSSIPEVVETKEFLFNPADQEDMAKKIKQILTTDEELKKELSQKALKNASKFNWRQTAENTLRVYKKLLQ
ncbi:MAG: glycosyltransferase family 4 protein [Actinobacteria bacterium]|nr:glycosyltransferase family 4 protein [Actinomycetota bacterium]MBM3711886.1 glycosyltransferase family 4 protein [Actinomycetota bacterium]